MKFSLWLTIHTVLAGARYNKSIQLDPNRPSQENTINEMSENTVPKIEPNDTSLVINAIGKNINIATNADAGDNIKSGPIEVAIPLPPLNL